MTFTTYPESRLRYPLVRKTVGAISNMFGNTCIKYSTINPPFTPLLPFYVCISSPNQILHPVLAYTHDPYMPLFEGLMALHCIAARQKRVRFAAY